MDRFTTNTPMGELFRLKECQDIADFFISTDPPGQRLSDETTLQDLKKKNPNRNIDSMCDGVNHLLEKIRQGIPVVWDFWSEEEKQAIPKKRGTKLFWLPADEKTAEKKPFVAICAGLIIFPACFSFGISPDADPSLIFITLPSVFINMLGGRIWGTLFFLFMTFASFSTVIAVFENLIASCMDNFGWDRRKTCLIGCVALILLGLPCALGYNAWSFIQPMGAGSTVLDFEDFLVSNLLLPGGSLIYLLFCVTRWGWNFDNYLAECNTGSGFKMPCWLKNYFRFALPVLILVILVQGL